MDYLPEQPGQLLLLTPSVMPGRAFLDRMERFRCEIPEPPTLRLAGNLPAGRYQMRMLIGSGRFDVDTLMLPLIEWPGQRRVMAGPFDFDHTNYRMAVPTFRVSVNGASQGLVWCEVPSPEDMAARRIRALWGIETPADGATVIELTVAPDDRDRLRWPDLAEMDLVTDDRYSLPLPASVCRQARHPRLLATDATFDCLRQQADPVSHRLRRRLLRFAESGQDGTYAYRNLALALLARVTDDPRWAAEAVERAMTMVAKKEWGYHTVPDIMGWNCDRDAGDRMFELAVMFDWLHEAFGASQRQAIIDKLAYHADIAYRVTLLQKNYWYHRCNEAHGMGLWCGLAAAAAVLLGHEPRAERWLEWATGGFDDAARHLPADGIATWYVFNIRWHVFTLAILESVIGRRFNRAYPFFDNFPGRVLQVIHPDAVDASLGSLMLFLARRAQSPRIQADAYRLMGIVAGAADDRRPRAVNALALLFFDPDLEPGTPHPILPAVCAERGVVSCRARNGSRFTIACGSGATAAHHAAFNFINRTWYGAASSGSFNWTVEWVDADGNAHARDVQPAILKSYRGDTNDANVISIDGRGHYLDGRWLGSTLPLKRVAFLEHCAGDGCVTYACGNATDAYADEFEVRRLTREWLFFHETGLVIMRDRVKTAQPRRFTWHLHATENAWDAIGPYGYATLGGDRRLMMRALASALGDDAMRPPDRSLDVVIERPEFVPTYTMGVNNYKTLDWQPELRPETIHIPPYLDLRFSPRDPVAEWDFVTAMAVDTDLSTLSIAVDPAAGLHIQGLPGGGEVMLPLRGSLRLSDPPRDLVAAAAARPAAGIHWRSFHTAAWKSGSDDWTQQRPPNDLLWENAGQPDPLDLIVSLPPTAYRKDRS